MHIFLFQTLKSEKRERGEHPELVEAAIDGAGGGPGATEDMLESELALLKETEEEQLEEFQSLSIKFKNDEAEVNRIEEEIKEANVLRLNAQKELESAKSSDAPNVGELESRLHTADAGLRMLLEEKAAAVEDFNETKSDLSEVKSSLLDITATVQGVQARIKQLSFAARRFEAQKIKSHSIQTAKSELTKMLQMAAESKKEQDKQLERESGLKLTEVTHQLEAVYREMESVKLDKAKHEEEGVACVGMAEQISIQLPPINKEYYDLDKKVSTFGVAVVYYPCSSLFSSPYLLRFFPSL